MTTNGNGGSNGSAAPASMAGVRTHEVVLDLFKEFVPTPVKVVDLAAGEGAFSIKLKDLGHDPRALENKKHIREDLVEDDVPRVPDNARPYRSRCAF